MGKKGHGKSGGRGKVQESSNETSAPRKLSRQKRNELNQVLEKLLKVSTSVPLSPNASREWESHLEIDRLLQKVNQLEAAMKIPPEKERTGCTERLLSWAVANGAEVRGVKVTHFPNYGLGLQAERDISEGELVVAIPRHIMLTTDTARKSPILGPLIREDTMLQHMPNVALSLLLLVERFSTDSFWRPYVEALPKAYTTVLYFTTQELQELKGSPVLEPALKQCRNIARQYAYFSKLFQSNSDPASEMLKDIFTYELYCWAVSTVMTRQNFVPSADGGAMLNALIPVWDMANHDNGALSTDFSPTQNRSECFAFRNFTAGEQVFIHYGVRPNSDLFVHMGFVFPDNEHDCVRLRLGVSRSDALAAERISLLARLGLPSAGDFALRPGPDPVEGRLLAFLRVFSMNKDQLQHWMESEKVCDLVYDDCALETELESRTWNFLYTRIQLLLSAYPTTLKVDEELLAKRSSLSPCHAAAVEMRACEKRILHNALEYVSQRTHT
ncbi:actin-histidine N-methyltransferase [Schistocerca cancellata]|uniref:actin-histidine N-methyltransferase n=1 Tax=Schistocerca cancellata TaxID=274614 RepID=UPI0021198BF1|nr:actin-histidine N-methyltransferase [Schistocerca cancellata]